MIKTRSEFQRRGIPHPNLRPENLPKICRDKTTPMGQGQRTMSRFLGNKNAKKRRETDERRFCGERNPQKIDLFGQEEKAMQHHHTDSRTLIHAETHSNRQKCQQMKL